MRKTIILLVITIIGGTITYVGSFFYFKNLVKDLEDCPLEIKKVCGVDDFTYVNECFMKKSGTSKRYNGECNEILDAFYSNTTTKEKTICDIKCFRYDPVCGVNGVTYTCGEAEANCNKVEIAYKGECTNTLKNDCVCTMEYRPVCGKDGRTYGNSCEARCAKVEIAYPGECKSKAY